jgi:hypothetical protein
MKRWEQLRQSTQTPSSMHIFRLALSRVAPGGPADQPSPRSQAAPDASVSGVNSTKSHGGLRSQKSFGSFGGGIGNFDRKSVTKALSIFSRKSVKSPTPERTGAKVSPDRASGNNNTGNVGTMSMSMSTTTAGRMSTTSNSAANAFESANINSGISVVCHEDQNDNNKNCSTNAPQQGSPRSHQSDSRLGSPGTKSCMKQSLQVEGPTSLGRYDYQLPLAFSLIIIQHKTLTK